MENSFSNGGKFTIELKLQKKGNKCYFDFSSNRIKIYEKENFHGSAAEELVILQDQLNNEVKDDFIKINSTIQTFRLYQTFGFFVPAFIFLKTFTIKLNALGEKFDKNPLNLSFNENKINSTEELLKSGVFFPFDMPLDIFMIGKSNYQFKISLLQGV